jgi:hypothetical protein
LAIPEKNQNQTWAEGTERLKMMRCEGLSKKDNVWKRHLKKILFD